MIKIKWKEVTWYSKLLTFLLFFILPVVGFYFGYEYGKISNYSFSRPFFYNYKPEKGGEEKIKFVNWVDFNNQELSFTFKYPKEIELENPVGSWKYFANPNSYGIQAVKLKIPSIYEPNTNFENAYFNVGLSKSTGDIQKCLLPYDGEEVIEPIYVGNNYFYRFKGKDLAAGNIYEVESYRTLHDNVCYNIDFIIHSVNLENYPPSLNIKSFNRDKIYKLLFEILNSFSFKD